MCGEHIRITPARSSNRGSSPHVRGTLVAWRRLVERIGIIPACAGNTLVFWCLSRGSSPHVRGTLQISDIQWSAEGIIPACAGNTVHDVFSFACLRDHPRMCGEHHTTRAASAVDSGSSPHVRGTLIVNDFRPHVTGIIPACAGNTRKSGSTISQNWDHPRMCGEHVGAQPGTILRRGIIPACAGNTRSRCVCMVRRRDHPRMCGEHQTGGTDKVTCRGSSPHVRGTHCFVVCRYSVMGIIPACAGNTPASDAIYTCDRDHPRMCGEHAVCYAQGSGSLGSSPHVRGTPLVSQIAIPRIGIIPACAGNTDGQ